MIETKIGSQNDNLLDTKDELKVAKSALKLFIRGLTALEKSFDKNLLKVVELITHVKGRVILTGIGKSGHIARKIAATLSSTGTPALFVHPSEASHGDLGMITEFDVVIMLSNSGESTELFPMVDYCKRFDIPIVSIARRKDSTIYNAADYQILLEEVDEATPDIALPTTSTTQMLVLGDILAILLYRRRGFTKDDFKAYHPGGQIGTSLLKVKDLMHTNDNIPTVKHDSPLKDAIIEMSNKRFGIVGIVNDNSGLIGVFTDGDLRRNISKDQSTIIDTIMTKNFSTVNKDIFASEALRIMNNKKITALFILEDGIPVGIVHMHDIIRAKVV